MKVHKAVPLAIIVIGLVLLLASFFLYQQTRAFIRRSAVASGVVTGFVSAVDREGSRTYRPRVRFAAQDYREVEFVSSVGSSKPPYSVGQSVSVLYDPADPDAAEINSFFALWFGCSVTLLVGACFVTVGGVVFAVFRKVIADEPATSTGLIGSH